MNYKRSTMKDNIGQSILQSLAQVAKNRTHFLHQSLWIL